LEDSIVQRLKSECDLRETFKEDINCTFFDREKQSTYLLSSDEKLVLAHFRSTGQSEGKVTGL
jgi:hypothetical protein